MRHTGRRARRALLLELRKTTTGLTYGFLVAVVSFFAALFLPPFLPDDFFGAVPVAAFSAVLAALSAVLASVLAALADFSADFADC